VERLRQKRLSRSSVDSATTRKPKKILVLVSGSGQPRDPHADPQDNSTSLTSLIVGRFVNLCYPEIQVIHVSSTGGMFRWTHPCPVFCSHACPVFCPRPRGGEPSCLPARQV